MKKREQITNGCIGLFRGRKALAKTIQWADSAYWNHSGLIFECNGRLMILDANAGGVEPEFLSNRVDQYVDFAVLKPTGFEQSFVDAAVKKVMDKDEKRKFKYDFLLLPKVLTNLKLGIPVNHEIVNSDRSICSVFTGFHYALELRYSNWVNVAMQKGFFTPQDHIRHMDEKWTLITGLK